MKIKEENETFSQVASVLENLNMKVQTKILLQVSKGGSNICKKNSKSIKTKLRNSKVFFHSRNVKNKAKSLFKKLLDK